ncbi:MAG TPA: LamG domain-containing protein [Solirubrobacteraceae bacterium]|nr:LamG domain-containing protein [Solirubrobacteraceae bacterium]
MRNLKLATGLALVMGLVAAAPAAANILPVAQWDLNENSGTVAHTDNPLLSNNGTLQGGVTWTTGRFQSGLNFDGTDGEVYVPDSSALEGANVTVSAWVNAGTSPGAYRYIVAKGASGCCTGSYGLYTGANGGLEFYIGTSPGSYVVSPDAGTAVWNGAWHNVVGTFDGSTVRVYVDGQQIGSGTPDTSPIQYGMPTSNDLAIGDYPWCSQDLDFAGTIDEVKVFNRALGPAEINLAYQASAHLPYASPFDLIL